MLAAYFDESGSHDESPIMVIAGLISPAHQWDRLTQSWNKVLNEQGLPPFHTKDCAHGRNAFEGWRKEERSHLYIRLLNLMKRHVLWRTWTAFIMPEYVQFFKNPDQARYLTYTIGAQGCASRVLELATRTDQWIPYVFERGGRGGKYATRLFRELIESGRRDFYRMKSFTLEGRDESVPLQAADVHAYEVRKYFVDQVEGGLRPPRKSFWELMRIEEAGGGGFLFGVDKMAKWLEGILKGHAPIDISVDRLSHDEYVRLNWSDEPRYVAHDFRSLIEEARGRSQE